MYLGTWGTWAVGPMAYTKSVAFVELLLMSLSALRMPRLCSLWKSMSQTMTWPMTHDIYFYIHTSKACFCLVFFALTTSKSASMFACLVCRCPSTRHASSQYLHWRNITGSQSAKATFLELTKVARLMVRRSSKFRRILLFWVAELSDMFRKKCAKEDSWLLSLQGLALIQISRLLPCDSRHRQCRFCGSGAYADIPCPRKTCTFSAEPAIPYYWDSTCEVGKKGRELNAFWKKSIKHIDVNVIFLSMIPYLTSASRCWQISLELLVHLQMISIAGCNADGIHMECRFCDAKPFLDVPCPPEFRPPYPTDESLGILLWNWKNTQNFETSSNECEILTGATSHKAPDRATIGTTTVS